MSRNDLLLLDTCCVASSAYADGWLTVQRDAYGGAASGAVPSTIVMPYGFLSRPQDPDGDQASCQGLLIREGNETHLMPTLDKRVLEKLPEVAKGGSIQYCSKGAFGLLDPDQDTWTLYIPVAFDGDGKPTKAHTLTVGKASDGSPLLSLVHADGMALVMQSDDKHSVTLRNKGGDASITLDDDGITLIGKVRIAGGLVAGDAGAKPLVTLDGLLAYLTALEGAIAAKLPPGPVPMPVAGAAATFTATAASST